MTVQAMNTRQFIEVATDTYVRGPDHRAKPVRMNKVGANQFGTFYEPPDDYVEQLFGRCITPQENELYKAVQQQLVKNILSGAIKTYEWPLMVLDTHPTIETIETRPSVILLADFKKWVKQNNPAARADWLDLIMDATEPEGEPIQPAAPDSPKVQVRGKATRAPKIPTQEQLDEYAEVMPFSENVGKWRACDALAGWLVSKGYFGYITGRSLGNWVDWDNTSRRLKHSNKALSRIENNRK